jgi:CheY-like chemotaxis protein
MIAPHHLRQASRRHRYDILLVEDNHAQALVAQAAHRRAKLPGLLHLAQSGQEAIDFLRRDGKFTHKPTPDLVLLDVNMPGKSGWNVLDEIKSDERLGVIPVLMLTTSSEPSDIHAAYARHANAYLTKPDDLPSFIELFQAIDSFWLQAAMLPSSQSQFA